MYEKRDPIDERIERYQRLAKSINDPQTTDGIARLVAEPEGQKKALHPEE